MWQQILQILKGWINKMIKPETLSEVLNVSPIVSNKMFDKMELWEDMYKGEAPWLKQPTLDEPVKIVSLGLPTLIASEKARMTVLEMVSEITPKKLENKEVEEGKEEPNLTEEEDERLKWIKEQYKTKVLDKLRNELEYGLALGGFVIKPYIVKKKEGYSLEIEYIRQGSYFPIAYDSSGKITEACFVQTKVSKANIYRRLEYHKLEGTTIHILNRAFVEMNTKNTENKLVSNKSNLGQEIPLTDVAEWAEIQPETVINDCDRLLFAYFKNPEANNVDPLSPLGMSCYGKAEGLIKEADMQYSRILWEYEASEMAIDIDRDALRTGKDSRGDTYVKPSILQNRLFRKVDLGTEDTYKPYSPQIRDNSLFNGLNQLFMRIEDTCYLSRGDISQLTGSEARTATELKILKQRAFSANQDIQQALQKTLEDTVYILNAYASLYKITPEGKGYEVSFEWDDSILVDRDTEMKTRQMLMQDGIYSKLEFRMWYFGETEEQAKAALDKIKEDEQEQDEYDMYMEQQGADIEGKEEPEEKPEEDTEE